MTTPPPNQRFQPPFTPPPPVMPPPSSATSSNGTRWVAIIASTFLVLSLIANAALGALWLHDRSAASDAAALRNNAHAEKVAMNYAVGMTTMDYHDLTAWKDWINSANTTPKVKQQLRGTVSTMEQLAVEQQMVSTATPIAASVSSAQNGVYVVNAVIQAKATNKLTPNGNTSQMTLKVTVDKNQNWLILDATTIGS